jgi:hypothetical protein
MPTPRDDHDWRTQSFGGGVPLWPTNTDGTVATPYTIDPAMPAMTQDRVKQALDMWRGATIARPTPRSSEADYVTFRWNATLGGSRAMSPLGRTGGQQFIDVGSAFAATDIGREIGHALGLRYEHQRPDRDRFVVFQSFGATITPTDPDLAIQPSGKAFGFYDLSSIMHYKSDTAGGSPYMPGSSGQVFAWDFPANAWIGGPHVTRGDIYGLSELYFPDASSRGDTLVSLSAWWNGGNGFAAEAKAHDFFCIDNEDCSVADMDADGHGDLVTFTRSGPVYVSRSDGSGFAPSEMVNGWFCIGNEVCATGDVDGDGSNDLVTFQHGSTSRAVYVATSPGRLWGTPYHSSFPSQLVLSDFCGDGDQCLVGDVDGDRQADLVAVKSDGNVWVSYASTEMYVGVTFSPPINVGLIHLPWQCSKLGRCRPVSYKANLVNLSANVALDLVLVTSSAGIYQIAMGHELSGVGSFAAPKHVRSTTNPTSRYAFGRAMKHSEVVSLFEFTSDGRALDWFNSSTGLGETVGNTYATDLPPACMSEANCALGDVNGDGAADLVRFAR